MKRVADRHQFMIMLQFVFMKYITSVTYGLPITFYNLWIMNI
jgi:hypothetical protein